jgi:adenine-specific DNA glycosylase
MFESESDAVSWCIPRFGPPSSPERLPAYEHAFTHFDLTLHPVIVRIEAAGGIDGHRWYDPARPARIGLSKPAVDLVRGVSGR